MRLVDHRLIPLKENVVEMMRIVMHQVQKCQQALIEFDKDIAEEVISKEKKVNSMDLKIDDECEKVIALHNPVASDLRFVLSSLKINTFLERIGDNAEAMAHIVDGLPQPLPEQDLADFSIKELFDLVDEMLVIALEAFELEDSKAGIKIFKLDRKVDEINLKANELMLNRIKANHENANYFLSVLTIIRKLERIGDLAKNIAEEVFFYVDAKVLKHNKKKKAKLISKVEE